MVRSAENLGYLEHKMAKNCIKMTKIGYFYLKSSLISSRFFTIAYFFPSQGGVLFPKTFTLD